MPCRKAHAAVGPDSNIVEMGMEGENCIKCYSKKLQSVDYLNSNVAEREYWVCCGGTSAVDEHVLRLSWLEVGLPLLSPVIQTVKRTLH